MPKVTVVEDGGERSAEAPAGQRLVLAIEAQGVEIGHRCGGFARCTTCRVEFLEGEPDTMTRAEYDALSSRNLHGQARLSCQITCVADMKVRPLMTKESAGWSDTGPAPEPTVTPDPQTYPKAELERQSGSA
jgi:ferredoxin